MTIITITSDLGDSSHYGAVLKGVMLSLFPQARIIDVTHNISNFNIMEAAYVVRNTFPAFPDNTIHIVAVDPESGNSPTGVVMRYQNQFFVGPDNGIMSLISDGEAVESKEIQNPGLLLERYPRSFRAARVFAPTAAFLSSGGTFEEVGPDCTLKDLRWGEPTYANDCLRGKIIHIDKFGNAVTNIRKSSFLSLKAERSFEIFVRNIRLRRIVNTYSDVGKADALAIFGESDFLEVGMREASAAELLGLSVHDMITIEFKEEKLSEVRKKHS
jgi:S-adenosylmethionine hydrolase